MSAYPNATTLRRLVSPLAPVALLKLRRVHEQFSEKIVAQESQRGFMLDADFTVVVVYGH